MTGEHDQSEKPDERRVMTRYTGNAVALVVRNDDVMRTGISGTLYDVSATGIGLVLEAELNVNEQVRITLSNPVQRVQKETRGVVRHITQRQDGTWRIGIELATRLTPLDVNLLKMGIEPSTREGTSKWV